MSSCYRTALNTLIDCLKKSGKEVYTVTEIEDILKQLIVEVDDETSGMRNKMVHSKLATFEQLHSDKWIGRKQVCETFDVSRATLDRCRRKGQIEAVAIPGSKVRQEGREVFPLAGYLYNIDELEQRWTRKVSKC